MLPPTTTPTNQEELNIQYVMPAFHVAEQLQLTSENRLDPVADEASHNPFDDQTASSSQPINKVSFQQLQAYLRNCMPSGPPWPFRCPRHRSSLCSPSDCQVWVLITNYHAVVVDSEVVPPTHILYPLENREGLPSFVHDLLPMRVENSVTDPFVPDVGVPLPNETDDAPAFSNTMAHFPGAPLAFDAQPSLEAQSSFNMDPVFVVDPAFSAPPFLAAGDGMAPMASILAMSDMPTQAVYTASSIPPSAGFDSSFDFASLFMGDDGSVCVPPFMPFQDMFPNLSFDANHGSALAVSTQQLIDPTALTFSFAGGQTQANAVGPSSSLTDGPFAWDMSSGLGLNVNTHVGPSMNQNVSPSSTESMNQSIDMVLHPSSCIAMPSFPVQSTLPAIQSRPLFRNLPTSRVRGNRGTISSIANQQQGTNILPRYGSNWGWNNNSPTWSGTPSLSPASASGSGTAFGTDPCSISGPSFTAHNQASTSTAVQHITPVGGVYLPFGPGDKPRPSNRHQLCGRCRVWYMNLRKHQESVTACDKRIMNPDVKLGRTVGIKNGEGKGKDRRKRKREAEAGFRFVSMSSPSAWASTPVPKSEPASSSRDGQSVTKKPKKDVEGKGKGKATEEEIKSWGTHHFAKRSGEDDDENDGDGEVV
jgi:hypothetical protein